MILNMYVGPPYLTVINFLSFYMYIICNEGALSLQMSVHDSYVVLGDRRSLPHDDVDNTGGLRHRSSHSSASVSPAATGDAVLDLSASKFRYRL